MVRRTLLVAYIATYLIAIGTVIRFLTSFRDDRFGLIALLLAAYLILLFLEPLPICRERLPTNIYLTAQIGLVSAVAVTTPDVDFWAALFFPLVLQAMNRFPQRIGYLFTAIYTVIMSVLMFIGLGPEVSLPLILINVVVYFFLAAFIAIIREAEAAREESQRQQAELRSAHRQLQAYTARAEELAVLHERSRLARELHDSITQSLHSSTMLAEAGQRLASAGDLERARGYLIRLGDISQQALREMRLLVFELRPMALMEVGLVEALQQRLDAVERRSGVEVQLHAEDGMELPARIEEETYRIALEALNNALKHGDPSTVTVKVRVVEARNRPCLELEIIDDGKGFDVDATQDEGGLGLISMQERIEELGGELTIQSAPGEGTRVTADVELLTNPNSASSPEARP